MPQLQKIEVDWEIYQLIEKERRSFDEEQYVALRRLLKLGDPKPESLAERRERSTGIPWSREGVTVPHGSLAKMEYGRGAQVYEGQFLNGKLVVNGQTFDSLSEAANALATTRSGKKTSLNGWNYWQAKFPGETKWRLLNDMRPAIR